MPERLPADALEFATLKHQGQTRKDAASSPYIRHPIAVALVLRDEGGVCDETLLTAALLHDTVEDTATTIEDIESLFGGAVAALVQELTDDKSLPKQRRKDLQVEHAVHASPAAKQLKIADKIANLRDLASSPPADWPAERLMAYVAWSESVFAGLKGVNEKLDQAFLAAADRVRSALDEGFV